MQPCIHILSEYIYIDSSKGILLPYYLHVEVPYSTMYVHMD